MAKKKKKSGFFLQRWMDSEGGKMFMNYAYSWGASIVILGALFKLTHIGGADIMLFLGMGTEVIVFFIAGFERPYDVDDSAPATASDGEEEEKFFTDVIDNDPDAEPDEDEQDQPEGEETAGSEESGAQQGGPAVIVSGGVPLTGGTIVIGGGGAGTAAASGPAQTVVAGGQTVVAGGQTVVAGGQTVVAGGQTAIDAATLATQIAASPVISASTADMTAEMEEATKSYVEQLHTLTEVLNKVADQSTRLTRDSEEMENLNRTLTGINSIYEIQLRSVSSQIGTIDQINEQTKRLAEQIEELNQLYGRMLDAMRANMKG